MEDKKSNPQDLEMQKTSGYLKLLEDENSKFREKIGQLEVEQSKLMALNNQLDKQQEEQMSALQRADDSRKTLMEYLDHENKELTRLLEGLEQLQNKISKEAKTLKVRDPEIAVFQKYVQDRLKYYNSQQQKQLFGKISAFR